MHNERYSILYSSATGNTRLLADTIRAALPPELCDAFGAAGETAAESELLYVGFWTDKGNADADTLALLRTLKNKRLFLFGTAGFGVDTAYFDAILARVQAVPDGRLYIAWCDGQPAGCIALRRLDDTTCELKRLYVRPAFRGRGIAGVMMQRILDDARAIGYTVMLLDTLPFLTSAIKMYRALGFYDIPPYNDSPLDTTIFLRLDL